MRERGQISLGGIGFFSGNGQLNHLNGGLTESKKSANFTDYTSLHDDPIRS